MSCRECQLSRESQILNIFSIFIVLICIDMRVINVFEEATRFESESRSIQFADSRGVEKIHWKHSEECQAARISGRPGTEECNCSRGIFTSQHLEHYEGNLRQAELDPNERTAKSCSGGEVVLVRVKEKKSFTYASQYFGITHGFNAHLLNIRNDRESGPDYLSTTTLAFTTKQSSTSTPAAIPHLVRSGRYSVSMDAYPERFGAAMT